MEGSAADFLSFFLKVTPQDGGKTFAGRGLISRCTKC